MKFSDYLIGNQWGGQMSSQEPIQPQQMQSIAPQQSMQSSVTDFWIKPNQSAPKKKAETFDVLWMLEKTNQFTQQAIKDNPVSKWNTVYTWRNKSIKEIQEWIEQSTKETHKLNTLLDMKRYIDDWATLEEFQADFWDVPQEILPQIYEEFAYWTKMKDILKLYPELDNIQPPQQLREKYDIKKFFNPLWEAGKTILKAKEKAKEDWSFLTSNPLTQWFMGAVWWAVKSVGDLGAWVVWISDKINSLWRSITEWWDIDQYSERPSSLSEDVFNTVSWWVGTVWSVFAMPASILINTGIEALPRDYQVALSDSMDWLGDKIAQTPWLKQWMESLPVERQNEFKQELANAWFWLLIWLKWKKNIITNPKLFLKENINPISIARNFNENVLWLPTATGKIMEWVASQLWDKVSTVAKWAKSKLSAMGKWVKWEVSFWDRAIAVMNGLDAETVRKFKDSPDIVKALDEWKITKESIKTDLVSAVDDVLSERNTVGSQYSEVYKNPERFDTNDIIEDINSSLLEQWVKIKDNKIVWFDTTKITWLTDQAKTALKSKYKDTIQTLLWRKDLSVEELHNIRRDLYSTSYQDGFANKKAPWVSKVSDVLNERLKNIPWFKEIDSWYKEAADLVSELKNNVLTKDGDFKGTLKALLWERWAKRMDILEKHFPWLRDKIETLAAYDDYLNTRNRKKVWLYEKVGAGAVVWFTMWWWLGAVIWAMAWPILSDFVRDPKWFKNYIISKAWDNIANKIELWKRLNINERTRVTRALKEIIKNPQAALPYKWELWETPNTILSQQKEIISSPNGNFRKGQILETNLSKNATTNTPNTNDNSISVKNKPKTNTLVSDSDGMERVKLSWIANSLYKNQWDLTSSIKKAKAQAEKNRLLIKQWKLTTDDADYWTTKIEWQPKDPIPTVKDIYGVAVKEWDVIEFEWTLWWKGTAKVEWREPYIANASDEVVKWERVWNGSLNRPWQKFKIVSSQSNNPTTPALWKPLVKEWVLWERASKNILEKLDETASKSDSMIEKTGYENTFDAYKAIWDDARASKAFERANLSTKEIKDMYKSWKLTKRDVQEIIYAKEQNAQSQYIYERGIKRTVDRGWKNENDIILSLKNMITDDKPSIWNKLDSLKANKELQPLYDKAPSKDSNTNTFAKSKDITNEQIWYKKKDLSTRALESIQFEWVYMSELRKKNTRYIEKYWIDKFNEEALQKYKDNVKYYISKGYDVPQKIIDKYPEFSKAVDARARYEKWLYTSFSNKDIRIDKEAMDKIWWWIKRQDGKELTTTQKDEIIKWVQDFSDTLWIDMKKISQENNIVFVHLNGKNAFLRKAAWLHRKSWDSYSISVWWKETITEVVNGKRVTEQLNTTMQHELWHAIDWLHWNKLLWSVVRDATRTYNPVNYLRKYFRKDEEITARLIEQYVAVKKWHTTYYDKPWFWKKEKFDELLPKIESKIREKFPTI